MNCKGRRGNALLPTNCEPTIIAYITQGNLLSLSSALLVKNSKEIPGELSELSLSQSQPLVLNQSEKPACSRQACCSKEMPGVRATDNFLFGAVATDKPIPQGTQRMVELAHPGFRSRSDSCPETAEQRRKYICPLGYILSPEPTV